MAGSLVAFSVSATFLVTLLVVFRIESQRGVRFFENVRRAFDVHAGRFFVKVSHLQRQFARDMIRQTLHFFLHLALVGLRSGIKWVHDRFDVLIRVNKTMARRAANPTPKKGTLADVIAHKKKVALSAEEMKKHKERAIGTRL